MKIITRLRFRFLLALGLCASLAAGEFNMVHANRAFTVAIDHPEASDTNPGTAEAPWRTLSHAASQARAGDTIHVAPGIYAESVTLRGTSGHDTRDVAPIRFIASGDGPAILDGGVAIGPNDVTATDIPGVFRWDAPQPLTRLSVNRPARPVAWVMWEGKRLLLHENGGLGRDDTYHFSRHPDHILINLGREEWPAEEAVIVHFRRHGFLVEDVPNVEISGFEFRHHAGNAIEYNGSSGGVIEDCHIVQPNLHGIYLNNSRGITVRRNRIFEPNAWGSNFKGQGHLIEENVFQTTGTRNETAGELWVGVLKFNGGSYITARHNFLADRPASEVQVGDQIQKNEHVFGGIWGDIHCYDNRIYGNSVTRQGHTGIYLELLTNRATVMWNVMQDNPVGISTRQSAGNIIRQNWIFDTAAKWGRESVDFDNMPTFANRPIDHPEWARERLDGINLYQTANARASKNNIVLDNLLQLTGRPISIPVPRAMDRATREDVARYMVIDPSEVPDSQILDIDYRTVANSFNSPLNNVIDRNLYVWDPERAFAGFSWFLDGQLDTFEEYQEATGMDANSKVGDFTPVDIGLQVGWTLQPDSRKPDLPLAFDYDGGAERAVPVGPALWARGIWVDSPPEPYSWFRAAGTSTEAGPGPGMQRFSDPDWRRDPRQWTRHPLARSGMRGLAIANPDNASRIPEGGLGWRSVSIPVTEGIEMDVAIHLQAIGIQPVEEAKGAEVVVVFTNWTGHNPQHVYLVGGDARSDLISGTYDWTEVRETLRVPAGAKRMMVYAGMHPGTGTLLIDDFEMSMVLPGELTEIANR